MIPSVMLPVNLKKYSILDSRFKFKKEEGNLIACAPLQARSVGRRIAHWPERHVDQGIPHRKKPHLRPALALPYDLQTRDRMYRSKNFISLEKMETNFV
jgi:hypothetical protein